MSQEGQTQRTGPLRSIEAQLGLEIRKVDAEAPWRWLQAGWADLRAAPQISLSIGLVIAVVAWVMALGLSGSGWLSLILALAFGFLLVGPFIAAGLYDVSRRIEFGEVPTLRGAITAGANAKGQLGFFGFILFVIYFVWINVALLLFMLFYGGQMPPQPSMLAADLLLTPHGLGLLIVGSLVGAVLAIIVFAISVISVPLLLVEDVDAVSAGIVSFRAVAFNPMRMALWAILIVALIGLGIATLGIGLIVTFPWIGHATWHAFRDTIALAR